MQELERQLLISRLELTLDMTEDKFNEYDYKVLDDEIGFILKCLRKDSQT